MPASPQLYYITNRQAFPGDEPARQRQLLQKIADAAHAGVDYIQLREKDLPTRDLEALAREAVMIVREIQLKTRNTQNATALLINSRTDVALAVGATGVHLRSDDISPTEVRTILSDAALNPKIETGNFLIGSSCHSVAEVRRAAHDGASFVVLAPIFGKEAPGKEAKNTQPLSLDTLKAACQGTLPVFALGGVTLENAQLCLNAGARGIAGIRLFQENDLAETVHSLRMPSLSF